MKDEYDFTDAEQGKFYRPIDSLDLPIYLDKEVREFFAHNFLNQARYRNLKETGLLAPSFYLSIVTKEPRINKCFICRSDFRQI